MRLASVEEARLIDSRTQNEYGISGEELIERAGRLAADRIFSIYAERLAPPNYAVVVCGPGNNGADGLIAARTLRDRGVRVEVIRLQERIAGKYSDRMLLEATVIVDALFGIGLDRALSGVALELVQVINESTARRVSLDTPSGLDAETGVVLGEAVMADVTLTFGIAKRGFSVNDGPSHIGRLEVLDIGFPLELVKEIASTTIGFDRRLARKFLPSRHSSGNKSTFGRVQLFAGSEGMAGAALLAANSAARIGAGYVVVATNGDPKKILAESPEFMTADLSEDAIFENTKWTTAIVGPGLGAAAKDLLPKIARASAAPLVVDADALTALSKMSDSEIMAFSGKPGKLLSNWILTPHAGELSRLLAVDSKTIEKDRFKYVALAARKFGCIVLLKGFRTVVSNGEKTVVILSGNAALAKAGMGDVLSGMIGGLLAQGLRPFTAACLGAYVHGYLADEWLRSGRDILSFQPSDLSTSLPFVLKSLRMRHKRSGK